MKNREYRTMQLRAADNAGDTMTVEGYAAVFDQRTMIWESDYSGWKYYEEIDPGAFNGADMSDVILRYNHSDSAMILARTKNGTLRLLVDDIGLKISADIAPTTGGKDIYQLIKRGDINQMSFAFIVKADQTTRDDKLKEEIRRITALETIVDVSPVDFPAYDGTSISARSTDAYIKSLEEAEKRAYKRKQLLLRTYL